MQSGANSPTGTFTGDVTLTGITEGDEKMFHFFYLGSGDYTSLTKGSSTSVDVDFSSQEIYADNGKLKNASAQHVGYGSAKGTVSGGFVTGINVTLVSKVAIAYFSFKDGTNPYYGALTLSGTGIYNSMKVNFGGTFTGEKIDGGNISLTGSHAERYVMLVPPANVAEEILNFGGAYEGTRTLENGIEANKFYRMPDGSAIAVKVEKVKPFTVGMDNGKPRRVEFSPGNLQYIGSSGTWKFAEHQWDYLGNNGQAGASSTASRDLFGWGCTGYKDTRTSSTGYQMYYQPYSTTSSKGYGPKWYETNQYGLSVEYQSDWGCLAIGTDPAGTWRTLSKDEWVYLLNTRTTATTGLTNASSRYAKVTVNGVTGLLVFPDSFAWTSAMGTAPTRTNTSNTQGFSDGIYTTTQFEEQEKSGVVFLPSAGYRWGSSISGLNKEAYYWSSTCFPYTSYGETDAFELYWEGTIVQANHYNPRYVGYSVRLVR